MLISIQYPFADVRSFLVDRGGRLDLPRWSSPDSEAEFVRGFGGVAVRPQGGASIGGEHRHCDATWAVRLSSPGPGIERRVAFRRFYADGNALAKLEIGIARKTARSPITATAEIAAICEQPACVPSTGSSPGPLAELGPALARAYREASTAYCFRGEQPWWVRAGAPLMLIMHNANDQLQLPPGLKIVHAPDERRSVALGHWWRREHIRSRRVWFLGYEQTDYALARQLRIDLARLHGEYEALRIILGHIATGRLLPEPRSMQSDELQRYLSNAISVITKLRSARHNVICETSCRLVEAAAADVLEEDRASLVADLERQLAKLDVRPNIRRKVNHYAEAQSSGAYGGESPAPPISEQGAAATPSDRDDREFSAVSGFSSVARSRRDSPAPCSIVLFLAVNPIGPSWLDLGKECTEIQSELRMAAARDEFKFCSQWAVTVDDLVRHLLILQPAIIHFSGHGHSAGAALSSCTGQRDVGSGARSGICLQNEHRQPHSVGGDELARLIATAAPSTRLVVLNACFSDDLAESLCRVVDGVVGMRGAIDDDAARSFAVAFYRALGHRCSVANAVELGAATLAAKGLRGDQLPTYRTRVGLDGTCDAHRTRRWTDAPGVTARSGRQRNEPPIENIIAGGGSASVCDSTT